MFRLPSVKKSFLYYFSSFGLECGNLLPFKGRSKECLIKTYIVQNVIDLYLNLTLVGGIHE